MAVGLDAGRSTEGSTASITDGAGLSRAVSLAEATPRV